MRIAVTGGAGFVGSNLARMFARDLADGQVLAFDNLRRRGAELILEQLADDGVSYVHGDIRCPEDLESLGALDLLIDCSAEPSVQAGYDGAARYVIDTNLNGTVNCLEYARRRGAGAILLSTSRVYPIAALRELPLEEHATRFEIPTDQSGPGWSRDGISAEFTLAGHRSLYGATKYASELLAEEYAAMYDLPVVTNRCSVIAGPWQMGKVDQGFVALWAARHHFGGRLDYRGFGGTGLQVRDVLHVADLYDLVSLQARNVESHAGTLYCVGGGPERSVSLRELTTLCASHTGTRLEIGSIPETHPADVPYFVTDHRTVTQKTGWKPSRSLDTLLDDVFRWLDAHADRLRRVLG